MYDKLKLFITKIKNAVRYRHFIFTIVIKEFKVRYAQSYLGMTWLVLEPLFLVLTLSYIFVIIGRTASGGHPFPVFFYSALLPWNYFLSSFTEGTNSFIRDAALIKKIYYPREISIIKTIAVNFIDFLFANIAFIIILIIYKYRPNWNYFYLIVLLILQTGFVYSLSLFTATISVYIKDFQILVNTLAKLWFWFTPIIFHYPFSGRTKILYFINPMAGIISNYRIVILDNHPLYIEQLYSIFVYTFMLTIVSSLLFKRFKRGFVDVL